jgi:hypothetical protein
MQILCAGRRLASEVPVTLVQRPLHGKILTFLTENVWTEEIQDLEIEEQWGSKRERKAQLDLSVAKMRR